MKSETSALVTLNVWGEDWVTTGETGFSACHLHISSEEGLPLVLKALGATNLQWSKAWWHKPSKPTLQTFHCQLTSLPFLLAKVHQNNFSILSTGFLFCSYPYSLNSTPPKNKSLEEAFTWDQVSNSPSWYCPEWNLSSRLWVAVEDASSLAKLLQISLINTLGEGTGPLHFLTCWYPPNNMGARGFQFLQTVQGRSLHLQDRHPATEVYGKSTEWSCHPGLQVFLYYDSIIFRVGRQLWTHHYRWTRKKWEKRKMLKVEN